LPDAGSNDYEQHKYYYDKSVDILVLDHHECEHESKHAVVINNQLSANVSNKNGSGALVTYKFLKALDNIMFDNKTDNYLDLVALGNIADMMDLKEKETRYLCYLGMEKINNPFTNNIREYRRYKHINDFEEMLEDNGIHVVKFYLHLSKQEQSLRFKERATSLEKK
jgi:single-stranded-DNA-specific exonuclease